MLSSSIEYTTPVFLFYLVKNEQVVWFVSVCKEHCPSILNHLYTLLLSMGCIIRQPYLIIRYMYILQCTSCICLIYLIEFFPHRHEDQISGTRKYTFFKFEKYREQKYSVGIIWMLCIYIYIQIYMNVRVYLHIYCIIHIYIYLYIHIFMNVVHVYLHIQCII